MTGPALCYGIPDIAFERAGGSTINPSQLIGHEVIVFFCPAGQEAAAREVSDYRDRAGALADAGAWIIGILGQGQKVPAAEGPDILLARDPGGAGWSAFASLIEGSRRSAHDEGGTFLFGRGGCLENSWPGSGHAEDALNALRQRG